MPPSDAGQGNQENSWQLAFRGHEFQAQFHWHVEDLGIRHAHIKARTPQLNGKVERSHRSDQEEFHTIRVLRSPSKGDCEVVAHTANFVVDSPNVALRTEVIESAEPDVG